MLAYFLPPHLNLRLSLMLLRHILLGLRKFIYCEKKNTNLFYESKGTYLPDSFVGCLPRSRPSLTSLARRAWSAPVDSAIFRFVVPVPVQRTDRFVPPTSGLFLKGCHASYPLGLAISPWCPRKGVV